MLRLLFILFSLFMLSADRMAPIRLAYQIDENSQLFLLGSTNVNNFKCDCKDKFQPAILEGDINPGTRLIRFNNAKLRIKTKLLSCRNNVMNRDMHKALKAEEFPYISVDLVTAQPLHNEKEMQAGKVYTYNVTTVIHIAGISKTQIMQVKLLRSKDNLYRLTASKDILMSDYEIRPRTPFNIIKIDDTITIHFELMVNTGK
nr:hypothetical protein [uncultured Lacibacter sp.]